jgi:hypothetical protein
MIAMLVAAGVETYRLQSAPSGRPTHFDRLYLSLLLKSVSNNLLLMVI